LKSGADGRENTSGVEVSGSLKMKVWITGLTMAAVLAGAGAALAQDAPAGEMRIVEEGAQWGAFARDAQRVYLIDTASMTRDGDVASASVARVRREAPAGDYSHVLDVFEVKCQGAQSRLTSSTEVEADGEGGEAYTAEEPWLAIRDGSLDGRVREVACGDMSPTGLRYPSIKAYIDAGRP
jgi:hypothetical protein